MTIPYDVFVGAFLAKITEYNLSDIGIGEYEREQIVDGYLQRALSNTLFKKVVKFDFYSNKDDEQRVFVIDDMDEEHLDEVISIISEGMLVEWLKPYVYKQENLENVLNTRDYTMYSPAELLLRVGNAYAKAQKDYKQMICEYSFDHGDLTDLHI